MPALSLGRIAESELGGATLDDALTVLLFERQVGRAQARQRPAVVVRRRLVQQHKARLAEAEVDAIRFVLRRLIEV